MSYHIKEAARPTPSSLLCEAAANGDNDSITRLLQKVLYSGSLDLDKCHSVHSMKGAKVNEANYGGRTALHLACSNGHLDTVKLLINHGASVNVLDSFHQTPLHNAIHFKSVDIVYLSMMSLC